MPRMDHTGPEGKGPRTGRRLGRCKKKPAEEPVSSPHELGKGMGMRRRSGGGKGMGRRMKSGEES